MRFRNPANGYVEEISEPKLWTLLFGAWYLMFKGIWMHAIMWMGLSILFTLTMGPVGILVWIVFAVVYTCMADSLIRKHYLRRGWMEVQAPASTPPGPRGPAPHPAPQPPNPAQRLRLAQHQHHSAVQVWLMVGALLVVAVAFGWLAG